MLIVRWIIYHYRIVASNNKLSSSGRLARMLTASILRTVLQCKLQYATDHVCRAWRGTGIEKQTNNKRSRWWYRYFVIVLSSLRTVHGGSQQQSSHSQQWDIDSDSLTAWCLCKRNAIIIYLFHLLRNNTQCQRASVSFKANSQF